MSDEQLEKTQHDAPSASPATASALGTLKDAQRLLQAARHFADALERYEAIEQVCTQFDCEALVEYLLPFLNDPDPLVRVETIDSLEGIPQPQIDVHLLGLAIADDDWLVRGWAVMALGSADYPWLESFLWKVYRRDSSHYVKIQALGALLAQGVDEAYPLLEKYLFSSHYLFVINAAHALADSVDVLERETLEALEGVLRERLAHWRGVASVVEALESCLEAVQRRKEECASQNSSTSPNGGSGASSSTPA